MNDDRRKRIREKVISLIAESRCRLEEIAEEENTAVEGLPDNLRESDRGERMAEIAYMLDETVTILEEAESTLYECIE